MNDIWWFYNVLSECELGKFEKNQFFYVATLYIRVRGFSNSRIFQLFFPNSSCWRFLNDRSTKNFWNRAILRNFGISNWLKIGKYRFSWGGFTPIPFEGGKGKGRSCHQNFAQTILYSLESISVFLRRLVRFWVCFSQILSLCCCKTQQGAALLPIFNKNASFWH